MHLKMTLNSVSIRGSHMLLPLWYAINFLGLAVNNPMNSHMEEEYVADQGHIFLEISFS